MLTREGPGQLLHTKNQRHHYLHTPTFSSKSPITNPMPSGNLTDSPQIRINLRYQGTPSRQPRNLHSFRKLSSKRSEYGVALREKLARTLFSNYTDNILVGRLRYLIILQGSSLRRKRPRKRCRTYSPYSKSFSAYRWWEFWTSSVAL
jgi:hypothetical protein